MREINKLLRLLSTRATHHPPLSASWAVTESVFGLTLGGDTLFAATINAPVETMHSLVLIEAWSEAGCVDTREIQPDRIGSNHFGIAAIYFGACTRQIDHVRIRCAGLEGAPLLVRRPPITDRTRIVLVLGRPVLIPGALHMLRLRDGEMLHDRHCPMLRWISDSRLMPASRLEDILGWPVRTCQICLPLPPRLCGQSAATLEP